MGGTRGTLWLHVFWQLSCPANTCSRGSLHYIYCNCKSRCKSRCKSNVSPVNRVWAMGKVCMHLQGHRKFLPIPFLHFLEFLLEHLGLALRVPLDIGSACYHRWALIVIDNSQI